MNKFSGASRKQNELANSIRERIIADIECMNNLDEQNQLANTSYSKEDLISYLKEKDDFSYFINQMNIKTNSVIISALMKLNRNK